MLHYKLQSLVLLFTVDRGRILKIVFTTDPYVYPANPGLTLDGLTYTPVIAQEWEVNHVTVT